MNAMHQNLFQKYPDSVTLINKDSDDEAVVFAYRPSICKQIFLYLLILLSLGVILLLFYWKPEWKLFMGSNLCRLNEAKSILVQDSHKRYFVIQVETLLDNDNFDTIQSSHLAIPGYQSIENQSNINNTNTVDSDLDRIVKENDHVIKYFEYQALRYAWDEEEWSFEKIHGLDQKTSCQSLLNDYNGFSSLSQLAKLKYYGRNSIEVKVKSYFRLFVEEVLTPFYIFQIWACALWMLDEYYLYAICIILISLISMILSLVETKRQSQNLHDMVKTDYKVNVCRGNNLFELVSSELLVPGDLIEIPAQGESTMTCDAVLINGTCILNESMLTGESVPVVKSSISVSDENSIEIYDVEVHKRNTLFNGTRVVQTRSNSKVLAVVVRTGFSTAKGDLVRSILYPKPMGFKFYQDSMRFILFLFCVALIGIIYGTVVLAKKGVDVVDIVKRALDIVTIVVPPALPAAMTVGIVYAQSRLKKKDIFCISPPRINMCGKLKLICFDKTGTLTEDSLDIWGALGIDKHSKFTMPIHNIETELRDSKLLHAMATCHSLSTFNGQLTGDPLDIKMFESTKWDFIDEQPGATSYFEQNTPIVRHNHEMIAIAKQFTFSSALLRMSVICKAKLSSSESDCMQVYVKGAPEKIAELCIPETVPDNFDKILQIYTAGGYRVIALAGKQLDSSLNWTAALKQSRDKVESDLQMYGLLIMQNKMKPETESIIHELLYAGLRTVMVTGDNLLTAISVARSCGMIERGVRVILVEAVAPTSNNLEGFESPPKIDWKVIEHQDQYDHDQSKNNNNQQSHINLNDSDSYSFAMDGKTFGILKRFYPDKLKRVLLSGIVFARMSPDQKAQLVENLIELGYCVSMCGDGANDCAALKAAHVGISLSEAEASVASPFTSKVQNISCVPEVIKEGRAALVTSFGVFKYMALYSMIQFTSVLILYASITNLTDPQFLYIDLFLITPVAVLMSANKSYHRIAKKRPLGSLVGFVNISSIILQILLVVLFQVGTFIYLEQQSWFVPNKGNPNDFKDNISQEGTTIFLISTYMYVVMAFVYAKGPPYRQPITENYWFVSCLLGLSAINIWITATPMEYIKRLLQMADLESNRSFSVFRLSLVAIAALFFLVSYSIEDLVVSTGWYKKLGKIITCKKKPKNKYKILKQEVDNDPSWPPVNLLNVI